MTNRRRFLAATAASPSLGWWSARAEPKTSAPRVRRYARLGRTELEISDISFGASMLRTGQEHLVEHAFDRGVNYFDTAEGYTGGDSERVIGKALKGKRDKIVLASKTFTGASTTHEQIMRDLDGSLGRLQTDHVDVFFSHAVNNVGRLENPEWESSSSAPKPRARFASLASPATRVVWLSASNMRWTTTWSTPCWSPITTDKIRRSMKASPARSTTWRHNPELPRLLERAKRLDVGVVAMKTLMGGRLNDMRPYERDGGTYAQAAFRWVLSDDKVDALIISMRSQADIDEYLGASGDRVPAPGDTALLQRYAELNKATYCRQVCNACEGACPLGVDIADVLRTRMYAVDYRDVEFARREYAAIDVPADACLSCSGAPCAGACPGGINIAEHTRQTHNMLS